MDVFPKDLPGLTWSVSKSPKFTTRIQTAISGRELRVIDQFYPIWTWTLQYSFLRDGYDTRFQNGPGFGYTELRELMGFFTRQQGSFNTFLYDDPSDDSVNNQGLGYGDGSTTAFQLIRTMGGGAAMGEFTEPITQPSNILGVYVGGAAVPYTLGANGVVTLSTAPAAGVLVSSSFYYYWPVRFTEDMAEFENFMYGLWSLKKLSFQSVILP